VAADPKAAELIPSGISTDSRRIAPGELFFALRGPNFDGHSFVPEAIGKGAIGAVVEDGWVPRRRDAGGVLISVADTLRALGDLAAYYRRRFSLPVIAVTGTNGKTTAKDMISSVLATRFRVLKTEGNYNNLIGVPLTIFRLTEGHEVCVLELGMSAPGEIRRLSYISDPNVGLITNVGPGHIGYFGSLEEVAEAKSELIDYLDTPSTCILNYDDPLLLRRRGRARCRTVGFGIDSECEFRGYDLRSDGRGCFTFRISDADISLRVPGRHNVYNALSAIAVGDLFGISPAEAKPRLEGFRGAPMRMNLSDVAGIRIMDDSYNSNPSSMRAAIDTIMLQEARGRRVLVLGDMLELGDYGERAHRELGAYAWESGCDFLFTTGDMASGFVEGALCAGMPGDRARHFTSRAELCSHLTRFLRSGDVVLVKGSRGAGMEEIVEYLKAKFR